MYCAVFLICVLAGFTEPETGSVIPCENGFLFGYCSTGQPVIPGQGEWTGSGPWGGNLKGLAVSGTSSSIVLAGCGFSMTPDAGGVWRSIDGGATWQTTELVPIQVNSVCSGGPASPSTFYAATRTGLCRSLDNGVT